jgi:hypothetical protein
MVWIIGSQLLSMGVGEQIAEQTVHYYQKQMGTVLPSLL